MIDRNENPVQWALLIEELNGAHEHLGKLLSEMTTDTQYDESRESRVGSAQLHSRVD
jgi:hypothetical protein